MARIHHNLFNQPSSICYQFLNYCKHCINKNSLYICKKGIFTRKKTEGLTKIVPQHIITKWQPQDSEQLMSLPLHIVCSVLSVHRTEQ